VLSLYKEAIRYKSEQKKKPAELQKLDAWWVPSTTDSSCVISLSQFQKRELRLLLTFTRRGSWLLVNVVDMIVWCLETLLGLQKWRTCPPMFVTNLNSCINFWPWVWTRGLFWQIDFNNSQVNTKIPENLLNFGLLRVP
jgi:hypothetical protein